MHLLSLSLKTSNQYFKIPRQTTKKIAYIKLIATLRKAFKFAFHPEILTSKQSWYKSIR